MTTPDFETELAKFGVHLAQEAQKDGVKLHEKTEAFKVLTPYYAQLKKDHKPPVDEGDGENVTDFRDIRKRVRLAEGDKQEE